MSVLQKEMSMLKGEVSVLQEDMSTLTEMTRFLPPYSSQGAG